MYLYSLNVLRALLTLLFYDNILYLPIMYNKGLEVVGIDSHREIVNARQSSRLIVTRTVIRTRVIRLSFRSVKE